MDVYCNSAHNDKRSKMVKHGHTFDNEINYSIIPIYKFEKGM